MGEIEKMSKEVLNSRDRIIQRADLRSFGLGNGDIEKPIIGIITSDCDTKLIEKIKVGIYESGSTPLELCLGNFLSASYTANSEKFCLPYRELVADTVETIIASKCLDGVVLVANQPMILAGMTIASVRVNLPTLFMPSGIPNAPICFPQLSIANAKNKGSTLSIDELNELELNTSAGDNTMAGNAFAAVLESLGLALPKSGTAAMQSAEIYELARQCGNVITTLVKNDTRPKMILGKNSLHNAISFVLCLGLSFDSLIHLLAIAMEASIKIDLDTIKNLSEKVPTLAYPLGSFVQGESNHLGTISSVQSPILANEFHKSGGVMVVLKELSRQGLIDGNANTVTQNLYAAYNHCNLVSGGCLPTIENAISQSSGIGVMYGGLAEDGCLYSKKDLGAKPIPASFRAKVFDSLETATNSISVGNISGGDAIIVRFEGPKGSPGMRSIESIQTLLLGMGLSKSVAIITDGRASTNYDGLVICALTPEAIDGGKLGIIKDGDNIVVDYHKSKLELDIPSKELSQRLKRFDNKDIVATGWLRKYCSLVGPANYGATTKYIGKR